MRHGEESCGIIPIRKTNQGLKILLVKEDHFNKGIKWGFPKGCREPGEKQKNTAIRETYEEVHLKFRESQLKTRITIRYEYLVTKKQYDKHLKELRKGEKPYLSQGKIKRKIVLFPAITKQVRVIPQKSEIKGYRWVSFSEAKELMKGSRQEPALLELVKKINQ